MFEMWQFNIEAFLRGVQKFNYCNDITFEFGFCYKYLNAMQ